MSAYVIYEAVISNEDAYERYKALASVSCASYGGRYLARGGRVEVLEGEVAPGRRVVIEFPTFERAIEWFQSDAYRAARHHRDGAAQARVYVVDGAQ